MESEATRDANRRWEEMRAHVLQASGMVAEQAGCNLSDAMRMMRDRRPRPAPEPRRDRGSRGRAAYPILRVAAATLSPDRPRTNPSDA